MTSIVELSSEFNVVERKHDFVIYKNEKKTAFVVCRGMRREGEMWAILDGGYGQQVELRGTTKDAAIARAVAMIRDGSLDRLIKERHTRRMDAMNRVAAMLYPA